MTHAERMRRFDAADLYVVITEAHCAGRPALEVLPTLGLHVLGPADHLGSSRFSSSWRDGSPWGGSWARSMQFHPHRARFSQVPSSRMQCRSSSMVCLDLLPLGAAAFVRGP